MAVAGMQRVKPAPNAGQAVVALSNSCVSISYHPHPNARWRQASPLTLLLPLVCEPRQQVVEAELVGGGQVLAAVRLARVPGHGVHEVHQRRL